MMENLNKQPKTKDQEINQNNILESQNTKIGREDTLESESAQIESIDIEEFNENIMLMDDMAIEEKADYMNKVKEALKKVGNISLVIGGSVLTLSGMTLLGFELAQIEELGKPLDDFALAAAMVAEAAVLLGAVTGTTGVVNLESEKGNS